MQDSPDPQLAPSERCSRPTLSELADPQEELDTPLDPDDRSVQDEAFSSAYGAAGILLCRASAAGVLEPWRCSVPLSVWAAARGSL